MKRSMIITAILSSALAFPLLAIEIDGGAVVDGALGGGAGAAVGSAVGGKNGAIIGGQSGARLALPSARPSQATDVLKPNTE